MMFPTSESSLRSGLNSKRDECALVSVVSSFFDFRNLDKNLHERRAIRVRVKNVFSDLRK